VICTCVVNYAIIHWSELLYILGLLFEIVGIYFMANRYINQPFWAIPLLILSSLFRGERATEAVELFNLSGDRTLLALQGLSFLTLGFVLRTIPSVIKLFE
jgi:hypothetical protein